MSTPKKKPAAKSKPKPKAKVPAVVKKAGKQQEKSKGGRPTDYCKEIADAICERLAEGESLRSICRDTTMPGKATVFRWLAGYQEFRDQYEICRDFQAETLADELINIADEVGQPLIIEGSAVLIDGKPVMIVDAAAVNHARLRVDARKWVASKLKPKKYGDKIEVGGPNGGAIPVQHSGSVALTPDEAYLRMLNGTPSDDSAG